MSNHKLKSIAQLYAITIDNKLIQKVSEISEEKIRFHGLWLDKIYREFRRDIIFGEDDAASLYNSVEKYLDSVRERMRHSLFRPALHFLSEEEVERIIERKLKILKAEEDAKRAIEGGIRQTKLAKFVSDNIDVLDYFIKLSGGDKPKYLGSGGYGTVFALTKDKVLKIFTGSLSPMQYNVEDEFLYKNIPFAAEEIVVYNKGQFESESDYNLSLGWVILERVKTIDSLKSEVGAKNFTAIKYSLRKIVHGFIEFMYVVTISEHVKVNSLPSNLLNVIRENRDTSKRLRKAPKEMSKFIEWMKDAQHVHDIKNLVNIFIKEVLKYDSNYSRHVKFISRNLPMLADNWLSSFLEQISVKLLSERLDLHTGNLGIRTSTGKLLFFDY